MLRPWITKAMVQRPKARECCHPICGYRNHKRLTIQTTSPTGNEYYEDVLLWGKEVCAAAHALDVLLGHTWHMA